MTGDQAGVIHGVLAGTEPGNAAFEQFDASVADKVLEVVKDSFVGRGPAQPARGRGDRPGRAGDRDHGVVRVPPAQGPA